MSELSELVNKVHCKDALLMLNQIPDASIDLVLTSPPYDDMRLYNGYSFNFEPIARETYRVLKEGGVCVWVVGDSTKDGKETLTSMRQALYFVDVCGFSMNDTMIYHRQGRFPEEYRYWQDFEYMFVLTKGKPKTFNAQKESAKYGGKKVSTERQSDGTLRHPKNQRVTTDMKSLSNVWYISRGDMMKDDNIRYEHPAAFPELLAMRHILTRTDEDDIVLDYFGGSGTVASEARKYKRDYITCDTSSEYCELMRRRLALAFTPMFKEMMG